jgi:hypothetical protein
MWSSRKSNPAALATDERVKLFLDEKARAKTADSGLKYFRSSSFELIKSFQKKNEEYYEAVRQSDKAWLVQKVVRYDGISLEENGAAFHASQTPGKTVSVSSVAEGASLFEAMHMIARYEATQADYHGVNALKLERDLKGSHFTDTGHGEGLVFDIDGLPHLTENNRPVSAGKAEFAESELALVRSPNSRTNFLAGLQSGILSQGFSAAANEQSGDPSLVGALIAVAGPVKVCIQDLQRAIDYFGKKGRGSNLDYLDSDYLGCALGSMASAVSDIESAIAQGGDSLKTHPLLSALNIVRLRIAVQETSAQRYKSSMGSNDDFLTSFGKLKEFSEAAFPQEPEKSKSILAAVLTPFSREQVIANVNQEKEQMAKFSATLDRYVDQCIDAVARGASLPDAQAIPPPQPVMSLTSG